MPQPVHLGVLACLLVVGVGCGGDAGIGSDARGATTSGEGGVGVEESSAGPGHEEDVGAGQGQDASAGHGEEEGAAGENGTGGAGTGGMAAGGAAATSTAGTSSDEGTAGSSADGTGGLSTGGLSTGGLSTGGLSTGGLSTGGLSTGGLSTGGVGTGGTATGGAGPGETCEYAGITYFTVGDTFYATDGCNTCTCQAGGQVSCTEMTCTCDPTQETPNRQYSSSDPDACTATCPTGTTPFSNDCGCGCQQSPDCPPYIDCMPRMDETTPCVGRGSCPYSPVWV